MYFFKQTQIIGKYLLINLLLHFAWSCSNDGVNGELPVRDLSEFLKFTGSAEGNVEGLQVDCECDLNLEIPDVEFQENGTQIYHGNMGGDILRTIVDVNGEGIGLRPFLFGEIELLLKTNDSVYLKWPGNEDTGIRFYDEISLFRGMINQDGTITGRWKCAPFDTDQGGYVDSIGIVSGTWVIRDF